MKTKPIIVSIAAIAALGLSGTAAAGGGGGQRFKTVRVTFQPTNFAFGPFTPPCVTPVVRACSPPRSRRTRPATSTGFTVEADATGEVGATAQTTLLGTFTGTVTGCGTGSFLYNGLRTTGATYAIVPGSGTGALEGISGVMSQRASADPTTVAPINGVFRCAVH